MALTSPGKALREIFNRPETFLMPFGSLPIHAQMAQHAGFEAFQLSGGLSAWWAEGVSDVGWLTQTEVVAHAKRTARGVDIPIYCDADTGYGGPVNVQRTVAEFIDAGVAGIHIEDQRDPKRSGGVDGIELVSDAEALNRLNAAVEARDRLDPDFVIVARTDGYASGGVEEAIRRGQLYMAETGVDVIFYEGLRTWEEAEQAIKETPGTSYVAPLINQLGQKTLPELTAMGQAIEVLPFVLPGIHEVWNLLLEARDAGDATPFARYMEKMSETEGTEYNIGWGQGIVRPPLDEVRALEEKYTISGAQKA